MHRICFIFLAIGIVLPILSTAAADPETTAELAPFPMDAPGDIKEVYLLFHDRQLCADIDAIFTYRQDELKIWCRVKDDGSRRKFLRMLEPLSESYRIETYTTRGHFDNGEDEEETIPPSLWENNELRQLLWFPPLGFRTDDESDIVDLLFSPDEIYRQRLKLFSEETLNRSGKLEHFAVELPLLTPMALNPSADPELCLLAKRVCRDHARELEKMIGRLEKNLKQALPGEESADEVSLQGLFGDRDPGLEELAGMISQRSKGISKYVYSFIFPDLHTVEVDELRSPDIFNELEVLRELAEKYTQGIERILEAP